MEIGRLLTAMITAFDREGKVDYAQAQRLASALLDSGSDGLVAGGTKGGGAQVRHDEKQRPAAALTTRRPCVLYNIPSRTGVNMTADTTLRLSRVPNIVGVKEAAGDLAQIARIIHDAGEESR